MKNISRCLAICVALAGIAVDGHAQFGGGGGMRRGQGGGGQSGQSGDGRGPSISRMELVTSQLYDLRMRLMITPQQGPVWDNFSTRYRDFSMASSRVTVDSYELSGLQAIEQHLSLAQNRLSLAANFSMAAKELYAALTPEQQNTADQTLPKLLQNMGK